MPRPTWRYLCTHRWLDRRSKERVWGVLSDAQNEAARVVNKPDRARDVALMEPLLPRAIICT
jgi:hypothetical protein